MFETFLSAESLIPGYLAASSPQGLFLAKRGPLFLVADTDDGKWAIMLEKHRLEPFVAWRLKPAERVWAGVHIGAVTLEIDVRSAAMGRDGPLGFIQLQDGQAHVLVYSQHDDESFTLPLARTGTVDGDWPDLTFATWRLVQRDAAGAVSVLFEHRPPPDTAA